MTNNIRSTHYTNNLWEASTPKTTPTLRKMIESFLEWLESDNIKVVLDEIDEILKIDMSIPGFTQFLSNIFQDKKTDIAELRKQFQTFSKEIKRLKQENQELSDNNSKLQLQLRKKTDEYKHLIEEIKNSAQCILSILWAQSIETHQSKDTSRETLKYKQQIALLTQQVHHKKNEQETQDQQHQQIVREMQSQMDKLTEQNKQQQITIEWLQLKVSNQNDKIFLLEKKLLKATEQDLSKRPQSLSKSGLDVINPGTAWSLVDTTS